MAAPTFELSTFSSEPTLTSRNRLENGINSALAALWSDVVENGGKIFASRQTAVDEGQAALPALFGRIVTMEGGLLVVRGPGQTEDQLFASYPNWGVVQKYEPGLWSEGISNLTSNVGKIYASRQIAVDEGQEKVLPAFGRIITLDGQIVEFRAPNSSADDPLFPSYPNWGVIIRINLPAEISSRQDLMRFGSVIPMTTTGGDGVEYNLEFPAWFDVGAFWLVGMRFSFIPNVVNTGISPYAMVGTNGRRLVDVDGGPFPIGYLDPTRNFTFEVDSPTTARLVTYPVGSTERSADLIDQISGIENEQAHLTQIVNQNIAVVTQTSGTLPPRPPRKVVYWQTWSDPSGVMQDPDIWLALPTPSTPPAPPAEMWDVTRGVDAGAIALRINYIPNVIPEITNFQVRVDGGSWQNIADGSAVKGYSTASNLTGLAAGPHTVEIRNRNYLGYGPVSEARTVQVSGSANAIYSDAFERPDGTYLSTIDVWDTSNNGGGLIHNSGTILSETAGQGSNPYGGDTFHCKGMAVHRGQFADNQYAICKFQDLGNNQAFGPGILLQADTQLDRGSQGYLVVCKKKRIVIYKNVDGQWNDHANIVLPAELVAPQSIMAAYMDGVITVYDQANPSTPLVEWKDTTGTGLPTNGRPGFQTTWTPGEGDIAGRVMDFWAGSL